MRGTLFLLNGPKNLEADSLTVIGIRGTGLVLTTSRPSWLTDLKEDLKPHNVKARWEGRKHSLFHSAWPMSEVVHLGLRPTCGHC